MLTDETPTLLLFFQAHMEAVHADWKEYLNLLICEENHLKHMNEYHKVRHTQGRHTSTATYTDTAIAHQCWFTCVCQYHKEARDTQDLMKRLDIEVCQKYNPEFKDVYQMEGLIRELDVSMSFWSIHLKMPMGEFM